MLNPHWRWCQQRKCSTPQHISCGQVFEEEVDDVDDAVDLMLFQVQEEELNAVDFGLPALYEPVNLVEGEDAPNPTIIVDKQLQCLN